MNPLLFPIMLAAGLAQLHGMLHPPKSYSEWFVAALVAGALHDVRTPDAIAFRLAINRWAEARCP